jgi:hypothetical protein
VNRTRFYSISTVDGVQEFDFLNQALSQFTLKYPVTYYRLTDTEIARPDLVSASVYNGNIQYWWVILLFNDIRDPFSEMVSGMLLKIPNVLDLYEIFRKYKLR